MRKQLKLNIIFILVALLLSVDVGVAVNIIPNGSAKYDREMNESIRDFGIEDKINFFQRRKIESIIKEVVDTVDEDLSNIDFIVSHIKFDGVLGYQYRNTVVICVDNISSTKIRDTVIHEIGHCLAKQIDIKEYKRHYSDFQFSKDNWETSLGESIAKDYRIYAINKYYGNIETREKKTNNDYNESVNILFDKIKKRKVVKNSYTEPIREL